MKGLFIPGITAEMFRNGCLESIDALMAEGEIYDIEYEPCGDCISLSTTDSSCTTTDSTTDCISRQAAKLKVARVTWDDGDSHYDFHDKCVDCLDDVPPAQPEKCGDCISRQAARNALLNKGQHSKRYKLGETWELNLMEIEETLGELPSVEPERKPGKWVDGKCNRCGTLAPFWAMATTYYCSDYCPKCGAKMDVETDDRS